MALVLSLSDNYEWPVEFQIPTGPNVWETLSFTAKFKRVSNDDSMRLAAEFMEFIRAAEVGIVDDAIRRPDQIARDLIVGWSDITTDDGKEVPFSKKALDQVLQIHGAATALCSCWCESLSQARKKT